MVGGRDAGERVLLLEGGHGCGRSRAADSKLVARKRPTPCILRRLNELLRLELCLAATQFEIAMAKASASTDAVPLSVAKASASTDAAPPSAGAFNLTAKNISKALKSAPLWLGFSAAHCTYCAVHEAQYSLYALMHAPHLPRLARVDAASERLLQERYEVNELPALVLAWSSTKFTPYAGAHGGGDGRVRRRAAARRRRSLWPTRRRSHNSSHPRPRTCCSSASSTTSTTRRRSSTTFARRRRRSERQRPDAVVRGAHATLTRALSDAYGPRGKRWIGAAPCAVVLTGADAAPRAAPYRLDEAAEGGLSLGEWAARAAAPRGRADGGRPGVRGDGPADAPRLRRDRRQPRAGRRAARRGGALPRQATHRTL